MTKLISHYKKRRITQSKIRQEPEEGQEETYSPKDVAEKLGIAKTSASERVKRYFKSHKLPHKPRAHYQLTKKQFLEIAEKRETISANQYRQELIDMLKAGRKDNRIVAEISRKYHIQNKGTIQGALNLYRHKLSKGDI